VLDLSKILKHRKNNKSYPMGHKMDHIPEKLILIHSYKGHLKITILRGMKCRQVIASY
jgi:hypothetical protein